jgi:ribose-phosphate pyrophosphokinase
MLFSGRSHPELAQRIAEKLGIQVGDVSLRTFASGETYCRYEESIRGAISSSSRRARRRSTST